MSHSKYLHAMKKSSFLLLIGLSFFIFGMRVLTTGDLQSWRFGVVDYGEYRFIVGMIFTGFGLFSITLAGLQFYRAIK